MVTDKQLTKEQLTVYFPMIYNFKNLCLEVQFFTGISKISSPLYQLEILAENKL